MKKYLEKYLFEIIFAGVLIALFFAFSAWQSTGKLTAADVDQYMSILEKQTPKELEDRGEFLSRLRAWGQNDDGKPIYMLNLMRFYDSLHSYPGAPTTGTPKEANAHYEDVTAPLLMKSGGYPIFAGDTTRIRADNKPESNLMVYQNELDNWDRYLVVRYPGRRTFLQLITNPVFLKVMPYKMASLQVVLTPASGELVIPDLRWVVGGGFLALFLLVGWIRAARAHKKASVTPAAARAV